MQKRKLNSEQTIECVQVFDIVLIMHLVNEPDLIMVIKRIILYIQVNVKLDIVTPTLFRLTGFMRLNNFQIKK